MKTSKSMRHEEILAYKASMKKSVTEIADKHHNGFQKMGVSLSCELFNINHTEGEESKKRYSYCLVIKIFPNDKSYTQAKANFAVKEYVVVLANIKKCGDEYRVHIRQGDGLFLDEFLLKQYRRIEEKGVKRYCNEGPADLLRIMFLRQYSSYRKTFRGKNVSDISLVVLIIMICVILLLSFLFGYLNYLETGRWIRAYSHRLR